MTLNSPHIFSKFGGTRFVTTIGCGFVSALLLRFGDLTGDQFVEITKWTVSVFIAGNAGQNIVGFLINNRRANPPVNSEGQSDGRQY